MLSPYHGPILEWCHPAIIRELGHNVANRACRMADATTILVYNLYYWMADNTSLCMYSIKVSDYLDRETICNSKLEHLTLDRKIGVTLPIDQWEKGVWGLVAGPATTF